MPKDRFEYQISHIQELPALPVPVAARGGMQTLPSGVADIVAVVSEDPSLAARVLRDANSAQYKFRRKISSISASVDLIGADVAAERIAAQHYAHHYSAAHYPILDALRIHSVGVGDAARMIARRVRFPNLDKAFTSGLLHDFGKFVIAAVDPVLFEKTIALSTSERFSLWQAEIAFVGIDHATIGARVLRRWDLPQSITEAVAFHAAPERSDDHYDLCVIVNLANVVAHRSGASFANDRRVRELNPAYLEYFGLTESCLRAVEDNLTKKIGKAA